VVLDKYVEHGPGELGVGELEVPPLNQTGTLVELAAKFGGGDKLWEALDELGCTCTAPHSYRLTLVSREPGARN
jgi:hypothetical protein